MKKNNTWIKVVAGIIVLELLVGGGIFAYKKMHKEPTSKDLTKDKVVQELYKKIAHEDFEIMDIMSNQAMLYYGYHNIEQKQSINCDVVEIDKNTTGYECNKIASFIPKEEMEKSIEGIYGPNATVDFIDFKVDLEHYAFYDEQQEGFVIYDSKEEATTAPTNLKLKEATKDEDKIVLTTQVLDGIYGTVNVTYKYTFGKSDNKYYLIKKEKISD